MNFHRNELGNWHKTVMTEAVTGGVVYKKVVLESFTEFTGKHQRTSPRARDYSTGVFL